MADDRIDIEFEQIVPWNGANDTGRDVRMKWQRNFERVKTALNLLVKQLDDDYLRKDKDDRTPHLLSSDKGFEVGEFVTGEAGGKVWLDEETLKVLLELDRILVRDHIVIGDALLEYDAENKAVRVRHRDTEGEESDPIQVGFYAEGFVSAKGASSGGQGSGGGASALYGLNDVLKNEAGDGVMGAAVGKVLMFNGTHWYAGDAKGSVSSVKVGEQEYKPSDEGVVLLPEFAKVVDKTITVDKFIGALQGNADTATKLKDALTIQKNGVSIGSFDGSEAKVVNIEVATKVSQLENDSKFLTEHQKLYALTIQGNGTLLGTYTPNSEAKAINITYANVGAAAASHTHTIAQVTGLQSSLDSKLNASVFNDLFEKVLLSDGTTYAIRAKYGFYSDSFVSAKGSNSEISGGGGGIGSIYVGTTQYNADSEGIVRLPAYPTVPTSLKNPYALTIQANGTSLGSYDGSAEKTVNITYANVGAAAASHIHTIAQVTELQSSLDSKLNASVFNDLFEKVLLSDGVTYAIRAKYGFYSDSFVSAKGSNSEISGGGGGIGSIYVGTTQYNADSEGIVRLPAYPTVPTSLKNPYALTIQANGTSLGTYDGSEAKTLNITYANVGAAPSSHVSDTTLHITSTERENWNNSLRGRGNIIGNGTPTSSDFTSVGTLCGCWNAGSNTNYGNLIQFYSGGGGSTNYVQFWSIYSGDMMWRNSIESTLSSRAWRTLIDSVNFSSYAATKVHTHAISDVTGLQTKLDDKYSSSVSRTANTVLAAPDGANGPATFRKLVLADLPSSVNSYTDLGLTIQNYSDYTWFVIGLFNISDTYRGGKGTSQGTIYIAREYGSHWSINIEYAISNYYSQTDLSQANQNVRMIVRQMTVESSMKPCTFIYKGVKYAGLAWTSSASPHKAKVMASYAQCEPFLIRYYRTSSSTNGEAILNSEIYNSIRIDDTDITYQAEYLFGNLRIFNGSVIANKFTEVSSITTNGSFGFYPVPSDKNNYYLTWGGSSVPFLLHNYGKITFESSTGYYFNNSVGINVNGNSITGTNYKLANDAKNPNLQLGNWYLQVYDSKMYLGSARAYSPCVDANGHLILPTNSRRIYFNGNTTDNQCIVYDTNCARICVGSSEAKGFNVGSLLVSSTWFDSSYVPTNGIYCKGDIYSAGAITAKASSSDIRLKRDLTEYDALSIVRSHRSVKYHWNMTAKKNSAIFDDDEWHYGLIAQELQREHPQLVKDVFGDYLTIDYERLIPILWRAVQQLESRNEELELKLNERRD